MLLSEQYRPKSWAELLGQPKALTQLENLRKRGLGGRAILISGKSGVGKTSAALLLAAELGGCEWNIEQIDGKGMLPSDVDRIARSLQTRGMGAKNGRVVIVDECQDLTPGCIKKMLVCLDGGAIPSHATWVFTTTCLPTGKQRSLFSEIGEDCKAWYGRLASIEFTSQGLTPLFAARCQEIARMEGLDGKPIENYVRLVNECKGSMREALQRIELGEMLESTPPPIDS